MATIATNQIHPSHLELKITLSQEDYMPEVEKSLKKLAKTVEIKGFRKGHVPMGMMKKMYGEKAMVETLDSMLNEEIEKYLKGEKIQQFSMPIPRPSDAQHFDLSSAGEYNFTYDIGIDSEVKLPMSLDIVKYQLEIDDESLNENIDRILEQNGAVSEVQGPIEGKDVFEVEIKEISLDPDRSPIENKTFLSLEMISDDKKEEFLGMNVGDTKNIALFDVINRDRKETAKHVLNYTEDDAKLSNTYAISILKIQRIETATLSDKIYKVYFPNQEFASEDEFKEAFRGKMAEEMQRMADGKVKNELYKTIADLNEIDVPESLASRIIEYNELNKKDDHDHDHDHDHSHEHDEVSDEQKVEETLKGLRWLKLSSQIIRDRELKVEQKEVEDFIYQDSINRLREYGMPTNDPNLIQKVMEQLMENQDYIKDVYRSSLDEKVLKHISDTIDFKDESISLKDFLTMEQAKSE